MGYIPDRLSGVSSVPLRIPTELHLQLALMVAIKLFVFMELDISIRHFPAQLC